MQTVLRLTSLTCRQQLVSYLQRPSASLLIAGHEIEPPVAEDQLLTTPVHSGSSATGLTVSTISKVSVPVTKKWITPADSVTIHRTADGVEVRALPDCCR